MLKKQSLRCIDTTELTNPSIGGLYQAFIAHNARQCLRSFLCSCFIIALCVALLSACSKSPKLPSLDANATILAFGDSLTFGTGAATNESYPAKLQAMISRKVIAAGVPGEVSADGLARLPQALEEHQPKLLILCHGGNDFLRKLGDDNAKSNVRAMVKLATDKGISVVLIATPKPGLVVKAPAFYKEIASEFAIPFDDAMLKKVLTDNELKSDLVHPNAKGYSHIAEELAKLLKRAGAI
jgi:acyl-CoA thioesterase I